MTKVRWWVLGIFFIVALALFAGYRFYVSTGGNALSRVVRYYFTQDLPDKKYSWGDFTDRGVDQGISGFYAFGDLEGFSMWTLSGLKKFTHVPETSIYMHEDICEAVKKLSESPKGNDPMKATRVVTGIIYEWERLIKQENLVTVVRMKDAGPKNRIDKVWSYSGIYKELNKLDKESCN